MRKLSECIVVIRGGGSIGSAIAQRLVHSHFRVCVTETASPSAICRRVCLSEAIFETTKAVEDISAERCLPNLESIYKVWRSNKIPVVADPEMTVKPLLKPDVLINAMMLGRESNIHMSDAPLVIGIGPGFSAGGDVHLVIEAANDFDLGKVIIEGPVNAAKTPSSDPQVSIEPGLVRAADNGVFTTDRNIGESVKAGDVIGLLNDQSLASPIDGTIRGLLRTDNKVLANTRLALIDATGDAASCQRVSPQNRAIAGGVLEAIMLSLNVSEETLS